MSICLKSKLQHLISSVKHVVCYIRKDIELMHAIEQYCEDLPIANSTNLNEKAYWFLHDIKAYPTCQAKGCKNKVSFAGLKNGYRTACCNSHAQLVAWPKNAMTNIKKFGSKTPLQNKEIRKSINKHNIETYGTENLVESEYFKKKRIETCQKNFGVDWPMQSEDVQLKSQNTCKEKYGVGFALQDKHVRAKGIETLRRHYGVDAPAQSEEVKEKIKATLQKNYGVDAPAQCPEIRRKQHLRYKFNGKNFDSAIEIEYYIWLRDHGIDFVYQPSISFQYEVDGKIHHYLPDFIVEDKIVEIKGDHFFDANGNMFNPYDPSNSAALHAKHKCMIEHGVVLIRASQLKYATQYVKQKYGTGYVKSFKRSKKI